MTRLCSTILFTIAACLPLTLLAGAAPDPVMEQVHRITVEATDLGAAYDNLRELTNLGPRLSGSQNAASAVQWAKAKLASYKPDRVWLQPVTVPAWVRGNVERATFIGASRQLSLRVTALGGSVGTTDGGVTAPVVEVQGLADVDRLGTEVRGKIVFYNRPMDPSLSPFEAYVGAVDQRVRGASRAAKYGAAAVLVRSMTQLRDDDHPHTGMLHYADDIPKIPAAALSAHAANELHKELESQPKANVRLELSARILPPTTSYNVIAEIKGATIPDEIVVTSGHLDSWDLGTGAEDDGAGVVQAIDTIRIFRALSIRPERTVRAVLYMSEEEGGIGGDEYAKQAESNHEHTVAALESDCGGYQPLGFDVNGAAALAEVKSWKRYLAVAHADQAWPGEGGTDVDPLVKLGTPTFGLHPDPSRYFDMHHSSLDTFKIVNKGDLQMGAAATTVFTYLAAMHGFVVQQPKAR